MSAQAELLKFLGVEVIELAIKLIKVAKDKNIDLDKLLEEGRSNNSKTIFDE